MSKVTSASKLQLVILDACRNNPFVPRMRGTGRSALDRQRADAPSSRRRACWSPTPHATAPRRSTATAPAQQPLRRRAGALHRRAGAGDQPAVPQGARRRADQTGKQQEPYTYGSLPAQPFYFRR
jgi:hypothetical protein